VSDGWAGVPSVEGAGSLDEATDSARLRDVVRGTSWEGLHPHAFRHLLATRLDQWDYRPGPNRRLLLRGCERLSRTAGRRCRKDVSSRNDPERQLADGCGAPLQGDDLHSGAARESGYDPTERLWIGRSHMLLADKQYNAI